jgi:hypothetical protein
MSDEKWKMISSSPTSYLPLNKPPRCMAVGPPV